jgi:hypothetical protein
MTILAIVARECLQEAAPRIQAGALTVSEQMAEPAEIAGAAPGSVDRALLKRGVAALIDEAIRRAARGSRLRITVKAGPHASMIAVKAPGDGIDPADADGAVPAAAVEAAAAHGGRAWANGRRGRGITWYLTLPAAPPPRATAL